MRSRSIVAVLAFVFAPLPLLAQFATVVAPPRRPRPPVIVADTTRRGPAAPAAEEQRRQMLDIQAWVDSAAGALAGRPNAASRPGSATPAVSPAVTPVRADSARSMRRAPTRPDSTRRRPSSPASPAAPQATTATVLDLPTRPLATIPGRRE